jgi:hypothetical protein
MMISKWMICYCSNFKQFMMWPQWPLLICGHPKAMSTDLSNNERSNKLSTMWMDFISGMNQWSPNLKFAYFEPEF